MRQSVTFNGFALPFVTGVELGVSITSPYGANSDVTSWLEESLQALLQLDDLVDRDVVQPACSRCNHVAEAGERARLTIGTISRQLAICIGVLEALAPHIPDSIPELVPPMRRAVAVLRRADKWAKLHAAYVSAESTDTSGMTDDEKSADGDRASEALCSLVACPAPDLEAVREKMRIMHATDTVGNNGFFEHIIADVEALTAGKGA